MTTVDEFMLRLFKAPRILLVLDDSAPVVELLHRRYDCDLDVTDSGEMAIQMVANHKYDIVIVDLALLNGTSQRVLTAVKKYAPTTPVVATKVQGHFDEAAKFGPLTVLSGPLTEQDIEQLFRVFKVKARTHDIAEYCGARHPSTVAA